MRTNLPVWIVVAAVAAVGFGCEDRSLEMADETRAHAPEDRPAAEMMDGGAGRGATAPAPAPGAGGAPAASAPAPGSEATPAAPGPGTDAGGAPEAGNGNGLEVAPEPDEEAATAEAPPRGTVVVIPPEELAPRSPAAGTDGAAGGPGAPAPTGTADGTGAAAGPAGPAPGTAPGTAPGGAAGAPGTAGAATRPGSPPAPAPAEPAVPPPAEALPVTVVAVGPDGARVELALEDDSAVPPGATLEIASPIALTDARFRLFDETDRLVASRDRIAVGKGTQVTIVPVEPLPPGSAFRLWITGQVQPYPTGVDGKAFGERSLRFHTTGEKPPPPPPPEKKRRRR